MKLFKGTRSLVAVVAVVVALAGTGIHATNRVIEDAEQMRFADRSEMTGAFADSFHRLSSDTLKALSQAVASLPFTAEDSETNRQIFQSMVGGHEASVLGAGLYRTDGSPVSVAHEPTTELPAADDPALLELWSRLAEGKPNFSGVLFLGATPTLAVGIPLRLQDGTAAFLVSYNDNLTGKGGVQSVVEPFNKAEKRRPGEGLLLLDKRRRVAASGDAAAIGTQLPPVAGYVAAGQGRSGHATFDDDGTEKVIVYSPVGDIGLVVAYVQNADDFYGDIRANRQWAAVAVLGSVGLLGVVVVALAHRRQRLVQRNEHRLSALFANATDVVVVVRDGTVGYVGPTFERLTGRSGNEVLGRSPSVIVSEGADTARLDELCAAASAQAGVPATAEVRTAASDGLHWAEVTAVDLTSDPEVAGIVLTFHDVTERKSLEAALRRQALYDALTSLPNRALFRQRLDEAAARTNRHGGPLALLFLDLDGFKPINDRFGHEAGDIVLREFGARLATAVRAHDTVARMGGDEFAVLVDDVTTVEQAEELARRITSLVDLPFDIGSTSVSVGVSVGVAFTDETPVDATRLLRKADLSMYEVKARSANRVRESGPLLSVEQR